MKYQSRNYDAQPVPEPKRMGTVAVAVAVKEPKPRRADEMPLVSTFERSDMDRAVELLEEDVAYQEQSAAIKSARSEIKAELVGLVKKYDAPGMRWGNLVAYYGGEKRKRTLSKELLVEYISLEDVERCYKDSKPYQDLRVKDLGAGAGAAEEEEE